MGLFGGGNSSSSQTTNALDASVTAGQQSTNTSVGIQGSGNVVTSTDYGSVSKSLDLAFKGIELAHQQASEVQASSGGLVEGALATVKQQQQQYASTIENIKTSDVRTLILSGMAVVGIVALMAFKRG